MEDTEAYYQRRSADHRNQCTDEDLLRRHHWSHWD
jgi:hypothetical protein